MTRTSRTVSLALAVLLGSPFQGNCADIGRENSLASLKVRKR